MLDQCPCRFGDGAEQLSTAATVLPTPSGQLLSVGRNRVTTPAPGIYFLDF